MKRVGLFFGSFNPVHNGHMEVAHYFLENSQVEAVWFVLSPQNPLKAKDDLLPNGIRLELLKQALSEKNSIPFARLSLNELPLTTLPKHLKP